MRLLSITLAFAAVCSVALAQAPDGHFVRNGATLYYTSDGAGKPLIMLAGGPGLEPSYLKPVEDKLKDSRRCVLFEQRGTGRSTIPLDPASFRVQEYVADLEALRVELKLDRLDIFGHSWGGMLAMAYAAAHPDRVGTLILCSSGGPNEKFAMTFGDNIGMRLTAEDLAEQKKWKSMDEVKKNPQMAADRALMAITPGYFYDRAKALQTKADLGALPKIVNVGVGPLVFRDLATYDSSPGLAQVHCKTLIIQGKQDPVDESTAFQIHDLIKGSQMELLDRCGHFPWIEAGAQFFKKIQAFLGT